MVNQSGVTENNSLEKLEVNSDKLAIISLTPKPTIFKQLREVSSDTFDISEEELNNFLDENCLNAHTVPVCIPIMLSPDELSQFIKDNSEMLIEMMLSAWPFPIENWGFVNKNIELFNQLIDIKYYPIICKAISKPVDSSMDLSVTFATPSNEFLDYIVAYIISNQATLSEDELNRLNFRASTGIGIITNQLEQVQGQDLFEFLEAFYDSKSYLAVLKDKMVQVLFYFYFKHQADFPKEMDNAFLNKWFDTKTFTGVYMFP